MLETQAIEETQQTYGNNDSHCPRPLTDSRSTQLQTSATLGNPLGCLRIAGNANKNRLRQQVVIWCTVIAGAAIGLYFASRLDMRVNRSAAKAAMLIGSLVTFGIIVSVLKLMSRTARVVDVFVNGIRFNDHRDCLDSRMELHWDQFDKQFNRVEYQNEDEVLNNELRQTTFKVRLNGAELNSKSHQISLYTKKDELKLARYIADQLACVKI